MKRALFEEYMKHIRKAEEKMTNGEKYKDSIIKYIKGDSENSGNGSYCAFIKSKILSCYELNCKGLDCHDCTAIQSLWLNEEYKEPEVDWSKVAVDSPVLIRDCDTDCWTRRYFAEYRNGLIYIYRAGKTFWSADPTELECWDQVKLAIEETNNEEI